ncbi:(S)-coclaurine N-methyltransferase-like isoform X2 [Prosopis cineraria]|uniref:(S)-coclaurine N-methyltransferase-like isoform X2 n=1 Tax=Prosopis cineraria TaxID=364024 RepID=UPI00240F5425|nr:(S)-coclaurine N-methyltransferase-like isoform X2 [Prosopis cineraria]
MRRLPKKHINSIQIRIVIFSKSPERGGGIHCAPMEAMMQLSYDATVKIMLRSLERNLLPDVVVRRLTRLLLASRLRSGYKTSSQLQLFDLLHFVHSLKQMPIAIDTDKPKVQHYELPTSFFKLVLGKNLKYSSCYFSSASKTLDDAEEAMLELYCERSRMKDGHTILDVGCGWGSLCIYIAKKYSNSRVTGICNSATQKAYIEERCRDLMLQNVEIIVADISTFEMDASYDRIFSIEMFEHMKNYKDLLKKIAGWLKEDGLLFVHHFCHKAFAYHFEDKNEDDWITKHFFTGGTMPSANLLLYFQDDVTIVNHWLVNGKHYAKTSEEWLKRMDQNLTSIKPIMESTYGKDSAVKWTVYWRTFFIAVAELFGYNNGEEWMVAHFLFKKK